ncbi:hypothetical protein ACV229_16575 [Burkholderia sp. MR1-5-21]
MKSGLMLMAVSALLLVPGIASAKDVRAVPSYSHQTVQDSGLKMMDNANASAQAETDMSYGGSPDTGNTSSGSRARICKTGSPCGLYIGR